MKISLDGGALCAPPKNRFGNYIFSKNLIKSINLFDKKNEYIVYSFCKKPDDLVLSKNVIYKQIGPKRFWMAGRVSIEEIKKKNDIFLALNQAIPTTNSRIFTFLHGLSYIYYQDLYTESFKKMKKQLERAIGLSEKIIVSSEKVRLELFNLYPNLKEIEVIPFGVSLDLLSRAEKTSKKENMFIYVGMDHTIKNISFIKEAFSEFKKDNRFKKFKLKIITQARRDDLIKNYSKAKALLTASLYESFNLPVLEALAVGTNVIGLKTAIIPELKKYVQVASSKKQFIEFLKDAALNRFHIVNNKEIIEKFSWKKYIEKLISLY